MRLTDGSRRARLTVAVDMLALGAFVLAGMRTHRSGEALLVFARTAAPVAGAWLVCSVILRTYRPPGVRSLVLTVLAAVPVGVLVRTAIVGSPEGWRIVQFLFVALAFIALFVGAGRLALGVVARRSREPG